MILRLVLVAATLAVAWLVVAAWERRPGRRSSGLGPGLTLVTSEGCRLCGPAFAALTRAGASPVVVDAAHLPDDAGPVHSVPTAILTDRSGRVVLRRTGRSVITDAEFVARATNESLGTVSRRRTRPSTPPRGS